MAKGRKGIDDMKTLKAFIAENRIRHATTYGSAAEVPGRTDNANVNPWTVVLKMGRKQLTVPFFTGKLVEREPSAEDVLDCLSMDASGVENAGSFGAWADEYGYGMGDVEKAEKVYNLCVKQSRKLQKFLGDDLYQELLWETERL
jgi:hypothetical protein